MKRSFNVGGNSSNDRFKEHQRYRERDEYEHKSKKRKDEEFDLVPTAKESKIFKIVFDYYTPRAHFVILPRDGLELEGHDYSKLQEKSKLELVKAATAMISEYKLEGGSILSIHRGSWITKKNMFHAHVCAEVNEFIKVFRKKEKEIPNWPSRNFVTRQWRASRDPRDYEKNVQGYPFKTYFREELQSIRELKKKDKEKGSFALPTSYDGYTLLYHPSEPRVGFVVEKESEDTSTAGYVQTLDVINKFAGEHGLTNMESSGDDKGCHICLMLTGSRHG